MPLTESRLSAENHLARDGTRSNPLYLSHAYARARGHRESTICWYACHCVPPRSGTERNHSCLSRAGCL